VQFLFFFLASSFCKGAEFATGKSPQQASPFIVSPPPFPPQSSLTSFPPSPLGAPQALPIGGKADASAGRVPSPPVPFFEDYYGFTPVAGYADHVLRKAQQDYVCLHLVWLRYVWVSSHDACTPLMNRLRTTIVGEVSGPVTFLQANPCSFTWRSFQFSA